MWPPSTASPPGRFGRRTRDHAKRNGLDPNTFALPDTLMYLIRYEAALGSELNVRAPLSFPS